jgi:ribose transport system ATP-binding protein
MDAILQIKGLCKYFGPTVANNHIDFTLERGEIRGLAGENGSGKSTLLQQIAGIYIKDEGTMILNGKEYNPKNPVDAIKNKIGIVVQELGVLNNLPAAVNVFAGRLGQFKKGPVLDMKEIYRQAEALFDKYGLMKVPFEKTCDTMHIESRKMVELARALSGDPDILILDEVTQSLSQNNRNMLYRLISQLKEAGKTIIIITHDLEEMIEICDNISVLRDGELIETCSCDDITVDRIKQLMVGREISGDYYRTDSESDYSDEVMLEVKNVTVPDEVEDVSFELHKGEILGFCGLSDSGIHDLGKVLYGITSYKNGSVTLKQKNIEIRSIHDAISNGMAYVPKDRDAEALMMTDSIASNFALPSLDELQGKKPYISPSSIKQMAQKGVDDYSVKCSSIYQHMDGLSGGNKQKVNLGRWLLKDLDVIIMDCPTRGVDVSVKAYIYHVMQNAKKNGLAIILISDELPEVLGMSDRLIVMKNGKIRGTFTRGENFTQEALIEVMV